MPVELQISSACDLRLVVLLTGGGRNETSFCNRDRLNSLAYGFVWLFSSELPEHDRNVEDLVTKVEGGSVIPIDLVVTSQEGADFSGTALIQSSTYTGTVEGEITRFGKVVMKVVLNSIKEGVEFTLNMSGTVSGENMSGAASALMNGYPVDSDYTWLSVRE